MNRSPEKCRVVQCWNVSEILPLSQDPSSIFVSCIDLDFRVSLALLFFFLRLSQTLFELEGLQCGGTFPLIVICVPQDPPCRELEINTIFTPILHYESDPQTSGTWSQLQFPHFAMPLLLIDSANEQTIPILGVVRVYHLAHMWAFIGLPEPNRCFLLANEVQNELERRWLGFCACNQRKCENTGCRLVVQG